MRAYRTSCRSLRVVRSPKIYIFYAFINVQQAFGHGLSTVSLLSRRKAKLAKDELDQALIEATNDDNWQASTSLLHEISSSAYSQ